jgi:hypothetical protein
MPQPDSVARLVERDPSESPAVTRERAAVIATKALAGCGLAETLAVDELRAPVNVYPRRGDIWNCWIAYAKQEGFGFHSSRLALVDRDTGEVLYVGSAHDEG